jgi:hypothetical protein
VIKIGIDALTEKLETFYYNVHCAPAKLANRAFGWTKYTSSKFTTAIGGFGAAVYVASVLSSLTPSGSLESLVSNSAKSPGQTPALLAEFGREVGSAIAYHPFDTPERAISLVTVAAIGIGYGIFYAKNWKRASVEEKREAALSKQMLSYVSPYEHKMQRSNYSSAAWWETLAVAVWPAIAISSQSLNNPTSIIGLAGIMLATTCIYGARYALYADFSSRKNMVRG